MSTSENLQTDVEARINRLLNNWLAGKGGKPITDQQQNLSDLGIDSLGMIEVVFLVAEEFGIDDRLIDVDQVRRIKTVNDLSSAVSGAIKSVGDQ